VDVTSLAFRTDLALLELGGSTVEDRGDHLVVRTPHNPTFWWGNFLLLDGLPSDGEHAEWLDRFAATFPEAGHVALGVDATTGTVGDLAGFTDLGLTAEGLTVMTASSVHEPPRPNTDAEYRPLVSDDDWEQSLRLRLAVEDEGDGGVFATRRAASDRARVEAGHGAWWGAFVDGVLAAHMGLLRASEGLARFQQVETHPDHRGRGLAGTLVHRASEYGFAELGATTLVMVADPDYLAIRIYRSVGFADTETQLEVQRPPADHPRAGQDD
jgi:ribosomal protein S18 acetylase RimI-like enzyme